MNTIQHEYFDGPRLDEVFADQTTLSGVLWPVEDGVGNVRDVISTAAVNLDHRKHDSLSLAASKPGQDQHHWRRQFDWTFLAPRIGVSNSKEQAGVFYRNQYRPHATGSHFTNFLLFVRVLRTKMTLGVDMRGRINANHLKNTTSRVLGDARV